MPVPQHVPEGDLRVLFSAKLSNQTTDESFPPPGIYIRCSAVFKKDYTGFSGARAEASLIDAF